MLQGDPAVVRRLRFPIRHLTFGRKGLELVEPTTAVLPERSGRANVEADKAAAQRREYLAVPFLWRELRGMRPQA